MSQNYTEFPNTDTLSNSHTKMIDNYKSFRSLNAGTSFPATLLYDGTPCWRTDLNELYIYDGAGSWDLAHATHPGDDFDIDTGALTGAVVVSDIDINLTTDTQGHVTDANASVAVRTLTLGNLGYTGETNATADQTAGEILTSIKTVDGESSGLDADTVDGVEAADMGQLNVNAAWTKQQQYTPLALTDAATIAWDLNRPFATVTIAASRILGLPTNIKDGSIYTVRVRQDATGSRALTYNAAFDFGDAGAPTLTVDANGYDYLTFVGRGTTVMDFLGATQGFT